MAHIFLILFFVCLFGVIRPFKGLTRKHFGIGMCVSLGLVVATAAPPDKTSAQSSPEKQLSLAEMAALEKKNAAAIATLQQEAAKLPAEDLDGNKDAYKALVALAPANAGFKQKLAMYEEKIAARTRYAENPEDALTLGKVSWNKGGFGSVMMINRVTISNDAPFDIKDFTLECRHFAPSGSEIDKNTRTIFQIVPANGETTIREFNMGFISSQAESTSCAVTKAKAV